MSLITAALVAAALGACRVEDPNAVPGDQPEPFQESVMGANAQVGSILLRSVHVEAPANPRYEPGDDATLWFTLVNEGRQPDTLTSLTSPLTESVEIRWDDNCDGAAQTVPELPLQPVFPRPNASSAGVPPFDAYSGRLVNFNREVFAGNTVPVTFTFANAGAVTVDALVQPSGAPRPAPTVGCANPSAPPVSASPSA